MFVFNALHAVGIELNALWSPLASGARNPDEPLKTAPIAVLSSLKKTPALYAPLRLRVMSIPGVMPRVDKMTLVGSSAKSSEQGVSTNRYVPFGFTLMNVGPET